MRKRLLFSLILGFLISNSLYATENEDSTKIYLYRPTSFVAIGDSPWIYIDGIKKGKLNSNSYQIFSVLPGKHKVVIDGSLSGWHPGRAELEIDTIANNDYFVRLGTPGQVDKYYEGTGASLGKAILILVNEELAQKELAVIRTSN